jgi:hypothetical protein
MTTSISISCPHCGAAAEGGGAFCESCGQALPVLSAGPRVVDVAQGLARTSVGLDMQTAELEKQAKSASKALLAVAIIQSVMSGIVLLLSYGVTNVNAAAGRGLEALAIIEMVLAAVYWGLYGWALSQPLPAAIVGLTIYATLITVNVARHMTAVPQPGAGGFLGGGIGVGAVDVIIMVVLSRAISAGVKHRNLKKQIS